MDGWELYATTCHACSYNDNSKSLPKWKIMDNWMDSSIHSINIFSIPA